MSNIPIEIVNIIIIKVAVSKGTYFDRIHKQIRFPAMTQCLNTIQHETLWLTETSAFNPFAFDINTNYLAVTRLPALVYDI